MSGGERMGAILDRREYLLIDTVNGNTFDVRPDPVDGGASAELLYLGTIDAESVRSQVLLSKRRGK